MPNLKYLSDKKFNSTDHTPDHLSVFNNTRYICNIRKVLSTLKSVLMPVMRLDNDLFLHHHNDFTGHLKLSISVNFFVINNDERGFHGQL